MNTMSLAIYVWQNSKNSFFIFLYTLKDKMNIEPKNTKFCKNYDIIVMDLPAISIGLMYLVDTLLLPQNSLLILQIKWTLPLFHIYKKPELRLFCYISYIIHYISIIVRINSQTKACSVMLINLKFMTVQVHLEWKSILRLLSSLRKMREKLIRFIVTENALNKSVLSLQLFEK